MQIIFGPKSSSKQKLDAASTYKLQDDLVRNMNVTALVRCDLLLII